MFDSTIGKIVIKPVFDGKGVFAGIKKFDKQLKGLNKPIKQLNSSFNELFQVAGIAGLTAMTLNAAKLGREMGLISRKTGIAVDRISSMQNAFAASGGDAKEVSRTLDRITTGLARISLGDASFTSALASMNISAWDSYGQLKNAEQVRLEWADWIKKQLDAGRSLASVATFMESTFGVSQAEVEELSVGSEELLKNQEKYNKKIGVLGKEEAKALNEINKSVAVLRTTVGVTYNKLIAESAPLLQTVLDGVQEVAKFFQDNKDLFGPLLTGLAGLSVALKALPFLFSAVSSHPLVALALGAMAAGYAAGGGFDKPKSVGENIKELEAKGLITEEEANKTREKFSEQLSEEDKKEIAGNIVGKVFRGEIGSNVAAEELKRYGIDLSKYKITAQDFGRINNKKALNGLNLQGGIEGFGPDVPMGSFLKKGQLGNLPIYDEQGNLIDMSKVPFAPIPIYDEQGNPVDLSKIPDRPDINSNVTIEQNMTINANGDVPTSEIREAVKDGAREGVSYIPAGNGQMQLAM